MAEFIQNKVDVNFLFNVDLAYIVHSHHSGGITNDHLLLDMLEFFFTFVFCGIICSADKLSIFNYDTKHGGLKLEKKWASRVRAGSYVNTLPTCIWNMHLSLGIPIYN